jgi:hypothetical protein
MSKPTRRSFSVRNHDALGYWLSDDRRFAEAARLQLKELEAIVEQVKAAWPILAGETLIDGENYPVLMALVRKRDLQSDSVKIFSAMAVEGFLNYYGVVRLGETEFNAHFERLGLIPKIRALLLVCDLLSVTDSDPLIKALNRIAQRRNALVHPKAKELSGYLPATERGGSSVPEAACEAVADMEEFFREFVVAVPNASHLVPPWGKSNA